MPPKDLQAKKRHHHVWANYLARWGSGTNNVFYTTKTGKIGHDSVRAIAVDNYFYKTTTLNNKHIEVIKGFSHQSPKRLHQQHMSYLNEFLKMQQLEAIYRSSNVHNQEVELHLHAMRCNLLEDLHASHEETALPILAALAEQNLDVLQDEQQMIDFMIFFGHQISRTKTFRDSIIHVLPRRNTLEIEVADAMVHSWWFLSYMFGMSLGLSFFAGRHKDIHALLINHTALPFITSDQPIVNVHSCVSETEFAAPEHSDFYYPISPQVAYIICDSERFAPGKNEVDEATVLELNTKVASQSLAHIIGDTESAIQPFKKYVGRRYQRNRTAVPLCSC